MGRCMTNRVFGANAAAKKTKTDYGKQLGIMFYGSQGVVMPARGLYS